MTSMTKLLSLLAKTSLIYQVGCIEQKKLLLKMNQTIDNFIFIDMLANLGEDDDEENNPDLKNDPIYQIDMKVKEKKRKRIRKRQ